MSPDRPVKVAIVGGGCAGLAAAFELTKPHLRGQYEVTVHQLGWRLGGKGASGRGPAGRIEEHGVHFWMGFYENAFRLMHECYAELERDPKTCPIATVDDAFKPLPLAGVAEQLDDGAWTPWIVHLPPRPGRPGVGPPPQLPSSVADYVSHVIGLLRSLFASLKTPEGFPSPSARPAPDSIAASIARFLEHGELLPLALVIQGVEALEALIGDLDRESTFAPLRFVSALHDNAERILAARAKVDATVRRVWTIADLTLATLRGILRHGLLTDPRGFDAIDEFECTEWLLRNGASLDTVQSAYLRGLYDLGFSYEGGDPARRCLAAGQALRGMLRSFFTYRGSFFWTMQAGMGDVVFAPLYEVLQRRGVRFEFFHRLENVAIAPAADLGAGDTPHVVALEMDVQAEVVGDEPYAPLVDVGGLPCWPSEPIFEQLAGGDELRRGGFAPESFWDTSKRKTRTLRVGRDFDFVVLAVGVGAVPHVCREIVARDARWRAMVDHCKTVATQAFQVWLSEDMTSLGWNEDQIAIAGFGEPFETWADMRHLLERESWTTRPAALAYFCSALPDDGPPAGAHNRGDREFLHRERARVRNKAVSFLESRIQHLWPKSGRPGGGFRWELIVDPAEASRSRQGAADHRRFDSQFWTANVSPSDRYALTAPGSTQHRISPLDSGYDNLVVAGDWTHCGFNGGCVEAAVMSGRLAAHALALSPALEDIVGYDHP